MCFCTFKLEGEKLIMTDINGKIHSCTFMLCYAINRLFLTRFSVWSSISELEAGKLSDDLQKAGLQIDRQT